MTLSPNATYGYSLPPTASMPLDMNSIVASLVEVTNALSVVMQQLGAGMSEHARREAGPATG